MKDNFPMNDDEIKLEKMRLTMQLKERLVHALENFVDIFKDENFLFTIGACFVLGLTIFTAKGCYQADINANVEIAKQKTIQQQLLVKQGSSLALTYVRRIEKLEAELKSHVTNKRMH